MQSDSPLNEVRGALDDLTHAMSQHLVEEFDSVGEEIQRYDAQRLLKYMRSGLLEKFVSHVSKVTELESHDAENLARTLINMAIQIRNQVFHFNHVNDTLRLSEPMGAITAIGCLLYLARIFDICDSDTRITAMNERLRRLATLYEKGSVTDDKPRRPSQPTVKASTSTLQLLVVSPPHENRRIRLDRSLLPVILGKDTDDDYGQRVFDLVEYTDTPDLVSQKHCELFERDGDIYVRDLGSTNGTLLNDQPIDIERGVPGAAHIFNPGDTLELGNSITLRRLGKGREK